MLSPSWLKKLRTFNIDLAWMHWNRLGIRGSGPVMECSTDPETLLLMTGLVGHQDIRLWEAAAAWLEVYESLIPIDRFKSLIKDKSDPPHLLPQLATLLRTALNPTQQLRWDFLINKTVPASLPEGIVSSKSKANRLQEHSWVIHQNTLIQLRHLFGPSLRADALHYILIVSNQKNAGNNYILTTSEVQWALSYNQSTVYRILESLTHSGVLDELRFPEADQRNKSYTLSGENPFFGQYARHSGRRQIALRALPERYYIRWPSLLEIMKEIDRLSAWYESSSKHTTEETEPLLKSQLNTFIFILQEEVRQSYIRLKLRTLPKAALKDIPLEKMTECIEENLFSIKKFIESPSDNT